MSSSLISRSHERKVFFNDPNLIKPRTYYNIQLNYISVKVIFEQENSDLRKFRELLRDLYLELYLYLKEEES